MNKTRIERAKKIVTVIQYQLDKIKDELYCFEEYEKVKAMPFNQSDRADFYKAMDEYKSKCGHYPKLANITNRARDIRKLLMDMIGVSK